MRWAPCTQPFLSFSFKGFQLSMVNDLPVSKPMVPSEIDRLVEDKDAIQLCPYYLELSAEVLVLQVAFLCSV